MYEITESRYLVDRSQSRRHRCMTAYGLLVQANGLGSVRD
jgi:hypothetical protein